MSDKFIQFNSLLLSWYHANKRDLPWRKTTDPYAIAVSEVMLQQTRVETVIPYFTRFMRALPSLQSLASCEEDKLLKLWEGLGYYSRARNLKKMAIQALEKYNGLPHTYVELLTLSGLGEYTAGAIASIAFTERVPAVDGNVLRVYARLFQDDNDVMNPATRKRIRSIFQQNMPNESGAYNQALMELGATICTPRNPQCPICPVRDQCEALSNHVVDSLPVRKKNAPRTIFEYTVLLMRFKNSIGLIKRPSTGLLAGLWSYPLLDGKLSKEQTQNILTQQDLSIINMIPLPEYKHLFTHREWHMVGYQIELYEKVKGVTFVSVEELARQYSLPSALKGYTKWLLFN